jgi:hypothetical protein
MRGAERPDKIRWNRPFLQPLSPLNQDAARQTFVDIADGGHDPDKVEKVLFLTDNLPLAINLVAHLADSEGCSNILSRWNEEKTGLISDGYDRKSNLDLSILLSLSSPRIRSIPQAPVLLSLLSILPEGLSAIELTHIKLPIDDVLACQTALLRTTLAYRDEQNRLKALMPIREYMQRIDPPSDDMLRPLLTYFQELLELYRDNQGTQSSSTIVRKILSNLANIQNVLRNGLQADHPDLNDSISCTLDLNVFTRALGRGTVPLLDQLNILLPHSRDHRLRAYFITELFVSWRYYTIPNPEVLVPRALEHFEKVDDPDLKCRLSIWVLLAKLTPIQR